MRFHYVASEPSGRVIEADVEAQGPAEVLEWMANQGLRPVSLKALGGVEASGWRGRLFGQKITIEDKVFLTRYLALMLKVGTDLFKAIDILISDFDKPVVKALLIEVRDALSKGQPFYTTFAKYPKYFSPVFVNLIRSGEASGNLERVFDDLSVSLEKEQALRSRIRGALVYPLVLMSLSMLIVLGLVTFALPKIASTFASAGFKPPTFSRIVFAVGLFLGKYVIFIFVFLIALAVGGWYFFYRTPMGQQIVARALNKIPVINEVLHRIALQRFAATLSSLLKSGMPIIESLEISAETVGSVELRSALLRISREGIAKGLTIGEAFRKEVFFPRVVVNLIAISERAGHLENILDTLASFYEAEIDASIRTLVAFLEPALLVVIGLIVAVIALAIIVPVYQLVGNIG
jgi:type II secretory pathway component PulF